MNKKLIVIMLLCIALPITNAVTPYTTFSSIPNYKNYVNVTVNSYNAVMSFGSATLRLGLTGYFYINTTFNYTLHATPAKYLEVAGFNSTGYFMGNITAYQYSDGLIIASKTQLLKNYTTATIFYNQLDQIPTYLNKSVITSTSDGSHSVSVYTYALHYSDFNSTVKYNSNFTNYTLNIALNGNVPYYLVGGNPIDNVSVLEYLTTGYTGQQYGYRINGNKATLNSTYNFEFTEQSLNATQTGLFAYLNVNSSKSYYLATDGLKVNKNLTISNLTSTPTYIGSGLFSSAYNYVISFYYTLYTASKPKTYYLVPAYSVNITVAPTETVTAPIPIPLPANSLDCGSNWYYDFDYRQPISNINWSYNFTTYADLSNIGNAITLKYGAGKVGYLKLNLTHYTKMGLNCENIFIEGYINGYATPVGNVPYSVYNCNSTTPKAQLILSNHTTDGFIYNAIYVYFGSRSNLTGFTDPSVLSNWVVSISRHNETVYLPTPPYLIKLDAPLNVHSILTFGSSLLTYPERYNLTTNAYHRYFLQAKTYYGYSYASDNISKEILVGSAASLYTRYLSTQYYGFGSDVGGTVVNTTNYFVSGGTLINFYYFTANIINNKISIFNLYTENYTSSTTYQSYVGSCNNPNATIGTYPLGNASSYPEKSNNFYFNAANINATLTNMHLNGEVNFLGYFKMSEYAVVIITLIGTLITIGISLDEKPLMLVFIAFWILGIYNIGFGVLALVLTLAYGAYRFTHHHK